MLLGSILTEFNDYSALDYHILVVMILYFDGGVQPGEEPVSHLDKYFQGLQACSRVIEVLRLCNEPMVHLPLLTISKFSFFASNFLGCLSNEKLTIKCAMKANSLLRDGESASNADEWIAFCVNHRGVCVVCHNGNRKK
jgi:hypothetical protein